MAVLCLECLQLSQSLLKLDLFYFVIRDSNGHTKIQEDLTALVIRIA